MKKSKTGSVFNVLVAVVLFIVLGSLTGCFGPGYEISDDGSGNRIFTVTKGIGHYSMELPPGYEVGSFETNWRFKYTNIWLKGPSSSKEQGRLTISISTWSTKVSPDAETSMLKAIDFAHSAHNFKLIDKSSITVAGVEGFQFSYSYEHIFDPALDQAPFTSVIKEVYFDHSGLIWHIYGGSPESNIESNSEDFEQVLRTFKVLN